jgi:hypothetical protein
MIDRVIEPLKAAAAWATFEMPIRIHGADE